MLCASNGEAVIFNGVTIPNMVEGKSKQPVFSVARKIYNYKNRDEYCIFLINSDTGIFQTLLQEIQITSDQKFFVLDSEDKILFSSDQSLVGTSYADFSDTQQMQEDYLSFNIACDTVDWELVSLVPFQNISHSIKWLNQTNFIVFLLIVLTSVTIILSLTHFVFQPIKKLTHLIRLREAGDRKTQLHHPRDDEIGLLIDHFQKYTHTIDSLRVQEKQTMQQKYELEFAILSAQINPHFLYNTLESIRMLALSHNETEIADISYNLGCFTRYSTTNIDQLIPIEKELQILSQYASIQTTCYSNRFTVNIKAEPNVKDVKILKFVIQPLLENAIIHGMHSTKGNGRIDVHVSMNDGLFCIEVRDNGCGIEPAVLESMQQAFAAQQPPQQHIGLQNVNNRIRLFYGTEYHLTIDSAVNLGTSVTVIIPTL